MPKSEQSDQHYETQLKDVAQIVIGAGMLALPVSMSEDTWDIAKTLPLGNVVGIVCASILLIAGFVYAAYFCGRFREHWRLFLLRTLSIYGLTVIVSWATLIAIDQAHWFTDPGFALRQMVLVALPASFAATIVDSFS
jgi:uncharacterized membrane protein